MNSHVPIGYGATLRRRREELALSLEDLAAATRIRKTYLQALEEENLQVLPGGAYAVGFLRIYAQQLGVAVEPLVAALQGDEVTGAADAVASESGGRRRRLRQPRPATGRGRRLGFLLLVLAGAGAVYLAMLLLGPADRPSPAPAVRQVPAAPRPEPVAQPAAPVAPPMTVPVPAPAPVADSAPTGEPAVALVELAVIPPQGTVVRLLPVATGTLKISLDGQETRDYQLQPEQALHWKVTESLAVELSGPGLVRLWIDQQELPVAEQASFILTRMPAPENRP
jgi:cytoskeleton protein RodZ